MFGVQMIRETCVGSRILNFFIVLQVGIGGTKVHILYH